LVGGSFGSGGRGRSLVSGGLRAGIVATRRRQFPVDIGRRCVRDRLGIGRCGRRTGVRQRPGESGQRGRVGAAVALVAGSERQRRRLLAVAGDDLGRFDCEVADRREVRRRRAVVVQRDSDAAGQTGVDALRAEHLGEFLAALWPFDR
jgi:hypothetical protein